MNFLNFEVDYGSVAVDTLSNFQGMVLICSVLQSDSLTHCYVASAKGSGATLTGTHRPSMLLDDDSLGSS